MVSDTLGISPETQKRKKLVELGKNRIQTAALTTMVAMATKQST